MPSDKAIAAGIGIAAIAGLGLAVVLAPKVSGTTKPSVTITEKILSQGTVSAFTIDSVSGYVPLTVQFTATATGGVPPYSYSWNFGDGTTGLGNPVTHTFNTASSPSYTVTCTVKDSIGNTASGTDTVTAEAVVSTSLSLNAPAYAQDNATITITATLTTSSGAVSGESIHLLAGSAIIDTQTTNSSGVATFSENLGTLGAQPGTISWSAQFTGDSSKGLSSITSNTVTTTVYAPLSVTVGP